MSHKANDEYLEQMRELEVCPYCKSEASSIGAGDEVLDYCKECEVIIEGWTEDDPRREYEETVAPEYTETIDDISDPDIRRAHLGYLRELKDIRKERAK